MWWTIIRWLFTIWGNLILARILYDTGFKPQVRGTAGTYICLVALGMAYQYNGTLPVTTTVYCVLMCRMFERRFSVCGECGVSPHKCIFGAGGGGGPPAPQGVVGGLSPPNYYGTGQKTNNQESFPVAESVFERYRTTMGYLNDSSDTNFGRIFFGHFIRWNRQNQYPKPGVVLLLSEGRSECVVRTTDGWWTVRFGEVPQFHVNIPPNGGEGVCDVLVH